MPQMSVYPKDAQPGDKLVQPDGEPADWPEWDPEGWPEESMVNIWREET